VKYYPPLVGKNLTAFYEQIDSEVLTHDTAKVVSHSPVRVSDSESAEDVPPPSPPPPQPRIRTPPRRRRREQI